MSKYVPGVCNIGKNEIRKRYVLGIAGFAIALLFAGLINFFSLQRWLLLFCFIPFTMASEGIYQGRFKFCAGFAAASMFDFSGSSDEKGRVTSDKAHAQDVQKAMKIHLYSLVTAALLALVLYILL